MATLPGLNKGVTKDPTPPATDTVVAPITIPNGTILVTTKTTNETIDNVDQIIDYISGDAGPNFIPQSAISSLVSDLAAKEDSLGFTPEDSANKGAMSGYAGLDASQELLLANFPPGTALQVLRRNTGNNALEFTDPANEVFTWTNNHDADGNNLLLNGGLIQFADADTKISQVGSNLTFDVAVNREFKFFVDSVEKLTITKTNTLFHGNNLRLEGGQIEFDNVDTIIQQDGLNLRHLVKDGGNFQFLINNQDIVTINESAINIHNKNIIIGTATGTKIATATNQKLGFWNATPIEQPLHIADPSGGATVDTEARTAINSILAQLASIGLQASV